MTITIYAYCTFVCSDVWCMLPRNSLFMGLWRVLPCATVEEGRGGMIDDNEMFQWTAIVSCKPKFLFSYLGSQPDKLPASLVIPNIGILCLSLVTSSYADLTYVLYQYSS